MHSRDHSVGVQTLSRLAPLALGLTLIAGACQAEPSEPSAALDDGVHALTSLDRPLDDAELQRERRLKAAEATPLAIRRPIDWTAFERWPSLDDSPLSSAARQLLATLDLPILLPADPALLEVAIATAGDGWYAVSMTRDHHNVYLHAGRVTHRLSAPPDSGAVPGSPDRPRLTVNEASPVLTFEDGGVSWSLIIECDAPLTDERCTHDAYIRDLARGLARFAEPRR